VKNKKPLKLLAIAGNIIFILWIVYNGIDEGSRSVGRVEILSLSALVCLLLLNIYLIWRFSR